MSESERENQTYNIKILWLKKKQEISKKINNINRN